MPKLTKVVIDTAVLQERQYTLWGSELKGFGVFVQAERRAHLFRGLSQRAERMPTDDHRAARRSNDRAGAEAGRGGSGRYRPGRRPTR